jgi:bacteriophage HK97-gp10 putative tail-component
MPEPTVAVVGLKALARDLSKASDERAGALLRYLKDAGREAAQPVASAARSAVPNDKGRLQGDIRVTATRTGAAVRMGRKTVPYAGWVEFGGTRRRPHVSRRDFVQTGRYLFPAARRLSETTATLYEHKIQEAFDHFPWTNATTTAEAVHD